MKKNSDLILTIRYLYLLEKNREIQIKLYYQEFQFKDVKVFSKDADIKKKIIPLYQNHPQEDRLDHGRHI